MTWNLNIWYISSFDYNLSAVIGFNENKGRQAAVDNFRKSQNLQEMQILDKCQYYNTFFH